MEASEEGVKCGLSEFEVNKGQGEGVNMVCEESDVKLDGIERLFEEIYGEGTCDV